MYVSLINNIWL